MDILTLAIIQSLASGMQVAALFGQYRMDKTHSGSDWWTVGSALLALGFAVNLLRNIPPFGMTAIIANSVMFFTGLAFLYVGVLRFFGRQERRGRLVSFGLFFILLIVYFTVVDNNLMARRLIVSIAVAALSFFIAAALFAHKTRSLRDSAHFLAVVFLVNGCFFILRALTTISESPVQGVLTPALMQISTYLALLILSTLWTFGFIIMVNQRLYAESRETKDHFELIFNTSPDAVLITRLADGRIVDINDGFTVMTGFTHAEVIGKTSLQINIWKNPADRRKFADELGDRGVCENLEFGFQRKDSSQLFGMISAKIITLQGAPHVLSVTRDITERKRAEKTLEESNRKLEALSITDGLTGIANRRHFDEILAQEHARHSRSGAELSLILLDIDHFKAFNDNYGHVKGDECLRRIARVIADCTSRPADLAARYGGEEFACILPETDRIGAVVIAEKIRRGILDLAIPHKGSSTADFITASMGVVTVPCSEKRTEVDILAQVDELLYRAKSTGRNRVEFVAIPDVELTSGGQFKGNLVQLVWKDSFCCGNQMIDSQHHSLFHSANKLLEAALLARPAAEISEIIARLLDEVSRHFNDEEQLLESVGFPGRSPHGAEHATLLAKGLELSQHFNASTATVGDVFQFLVYDVVMVHLLGADREYFPFLNDAGGSDSSA